jgi:hypothetical protein
MMYAAQRDKGRKTGAVWRANRSRTLRIPLATALGLGVALTILPAQAADAMSAEVIAVQIRAQGYACDKALSAEREHPELDDAVWILKCDNARYRVRLIPDMAAKVEKLD